MKAGSHAACGSPGELVRRADAPRARRHPVISAVVWIAGAVLLLGPWALDVVDHHSR
jgi:hypothetical protein